MRRLSQSCHLDVHSPWGKQRVTELLRTMVEIGEILYSNPVNRTQDVLRFHNITFTHGVLCRELFETPKTMSREELFGRYFHAITYHAPLTLRIISPSSLNTELQERLFN